MSKLLLEVYLPAALKSFDIQVPADMQLAQVTELVSGALEQMTGQFMADETSILCDRDSGDILNINMTAWELGLRNGSKLMLI